MTLAVDGNSKTHIDTRTHTPSGVRSPVSGMISPNISLKCSLLSCSCQWSVLTSRWQGLALWSFPGHANFFYQTHMTFRTHLALTFTFVEKLFIHLICLSAGSVY